MAFGYVVATLIEALGDGLWFMGCGSLFLLLTKCEPLPLRWTVTALCVAPLLWFMSITLMAILRVT
jgi:hypothetical protein